jgi:hypothetical protein
MTLTMQYTGTLVIETCCNCSITFAIPSDFRDRALKNHSISFYCPLGHSQHFIGETEEQKLTRQLRAARSNAEWAKDQLSASERSKAAIKGHATRLRNKLAKGQCPCCDMTFGNVREHIKFKHPDYVITDVETGVIEK